MRQVFTFLLIISQDNYENIKLNQMLLVINPYTFCYPFLSYNFSEAKLRICMVIRFFLSFLVPKSKKSLKYQSPESLSLTELVNLTDNVRIFSYAVVYIG